jgi:hypothetical protein
MGLDCSTQIGGSVRTGLGFYSDWMLLESKVASSLRLGHTGRVGMAAPPRLGLALSIWCPRSAAGRPGRRLAHVGVRVGQIAAGVEDWGREATSSHQTVTSAGLPLLLAGSDSVPSLACCWYPWPGSGPRRLPASACPTLTEATPALQDVGESRGQGHVQATCSTTSGPARPSQTISPDLRFLSGLGMAQARHPPSPRAQDSGVLQQAGGRGIPKKQTSQFFP